MHGSGELGALETAWAAQAMSTKRNPNLLFGTVEGHQDRDVDGVHHRSTIPNKKFGFPALAFDSTASLKKRQQQRDGRRNSQAT